MRRFLYISPYFPPQSRVGALRPLKFARCLPEFGWTPVVLCDLWDSAPQNTALLDAVPDSTVVIRNYSHRAMSAASKMGTARQTTAPSQPGNRLNLKRFVPSALTNPELVPLGEHSIHIPHALRAAHAALDQSPCEAIIVNADPYAALMVGAKLARQTGLPLIQDLRDPWSVCELRRPRRPGPIRRLVDRLERRAFDAAARIIVNTQTTLADYRKHYPDYDPSKFACIRNHSDPTLFANGDHPGFSRFTLLFLGNFRRFLDGTSLLLLLAALRSRGVGPDRLQLVVTGEIGSEAMAKAAEMGVQEMLQPHPFIPYTEIGPAMARADILVILSNDTRGRIPAKLYDYVQTKRPILSIASNDELRSLVERHGGQMFHFDQIDAMAEVVVSQLDSGTADVARPYANELSSRRAAKELAGILDEITETKTNR